MFLLNSCLGQFSAASSHWHSFSRSYGVILPSSLTMLLPSALGFSPHLPVSVYGTGTVQTIAAFLGSWLTHFPTSVRYASRLRIIERICQLYSYLACRGIPFPLVLSLCVPTVLLYCSTGISTCCPSATSFDLTLGPDLPRADRFTLETLGIRPEGFSPSSRYSFRHSLFLKVHSSFRYCFFPLRMLLYQLTTLIPELR